MVIRLICEYVCGKLFYVLLLLKVRFLDSRLRWLCWDSSILNMLCVLFMWLIVVSVLMY